VPSAVDEEGRCSIHAASHTTREIAADSFCEPAFLKSQLQHPSIELQTIPEHREDGWFKSLLVLKEQVMHGPEFSLGCRELGGLGGGFRPRMRLLKRKVAEHKAKTIPKVLLHGFYNRIGSTAVGALIISILDQGHRRVCLPLRGRAITPSNDAGSINNKQRPFGDAVAILLAIIRKRIFLNIRPGWQGELAELEAEVVEVAVG
jgi:hypothetical protein